MRRLLFALPLLLLASQQNALAQVGANAPDGPAIGGYDVVAYFTKNKAVKGKSHISANWNNDTWLFSSQKYKDLFLQNPSAYAPQYNGWCAYAAVQGYAAEVDPKHGWAIIDNRLYLNWSKSVNRAWLRSAKSNIRAANQQWPELKRSINDGTANFSRRRLPPKIRALCIPRYTAHYSLSSDSPCSSSPATSSCETP